MKYLIRAIAVVLVLTLTVQIQSHSRADTYTLSWTPPTEYENNTPLPEQDLDYYTLYIDDEPVIELDVIIGTWTTDITIDEEGTYVISLTVTAINGQESRRSGTVNFTVGPRIPGAPMNLILNGKDLGAQYE